MGTSNENRFNDLREAVNNIDTRVVKLEDKIGMTREEALSSNAKLKY